MPREVNSLIVGLTGGIGSGKSAVADRFAARGAAIIDTDVISRQLTGPGGAALPAIAEAFGPAMIAADGALDRAAMRRCVFADPAARQRLEAILHPLIRQMADRQMADALAAGLPYGILVVPLLVESGDYRSRVDRVLVVDCPESLQVERVMARSGLSADDVAAILAAQARRADRLAAADDVIVNDQGWTALDRRVDELHRNYLHLAEKTPFPVEIWWGIGQNRTNFPPWPARDHLRISSQRARSHPVAS